MIKELTKGVDQTLFLLFLSEGFYNYFLCIMRQ